MEDVGGNRVLFQSLQLKNMRTGTNRTEEDESQARLHHSRPITSGSLHGHCRISFFTCQKWHNFYDEALLSSQGAGFIRFSFVCRALICPQRASWGLMAVSHECWARSTNLRGCYLTSRVVSPPESQRGRPGSVLFPHRWRSTLLFFPLTRQVAKCLCYSDTEYCLSDLQLCTRKRVLQPCPK